MLCDFHLLWDEATVLGNLTFDTRLPKIAGFTVVLTPGPGVAVRCDMRP